MPGRRARRRGRTRATTSAACTSASTTCARRTGTRRAFAADHAASLDFLAERCDRVLAVTLPLDLGRPRAAGVAEANAAIERTRATRGALVLDLRGFGARNLVMADHVHPTAFGQVGSPSARSTCSAADGMDVRVRPVGADPAADRGRAARASRATGPTSTGSSRIGPRCGAVARERRPLARAASDVGRGGAPSCASRLGT